MAAAWVATVGHRLWHSDDLERWQAVGDVPADARLYALIANATGGDGGGYART